MSSIQHSLLEPTVQRVTGSPQTTNHSLALVTAVLKSWQRGKREEKEGDIHRMREREKKRRGEGSESGERRAINSDLGVGKETSIFLQIFIISGEAGSDSGEQQSSKLLSLYIVHTEHCNLQAIDEARSWGEREEDPPVPAAHS